MHCIYFLSRKPVFCLGLLQLYLSFDIWQPWRGGCNFFFQLWSRSWNVIAFSTKNSIMCFALFIYPNFFHSPCFTFVSCKNEQFSYYVGILVYVYVFVWTWLRVCAILICCGFIETSTLWRDHSLITHTLTHFQISLYPISFKEYEKNSSPLSLSLSH